MKPTKKQLKYILSDKTKYCIYRPNKPVLIRAYGTWFEVPYSVEGDVLEKEITRIDIVLDIT